MTESRKYDPEVPGNDALFVKSNGVIVAHMGWSGMSGEPLRKRAPNIQMFHCYWPDAGNEDDHMTVPVCGVTPRDALEALRRYDAGLAAYVEESGVLFQTRCHPVPLGEE